MSAYRAGFVHTQGKHEIKQFWVIVHPYFPYGAVERQPLNFGQNPFIWQDFCLKLYGNERDLTERGAPIRSGPLDPQMLCSGREGCRTASNSLPLSCSPQPSAKFVYMSVTFTNMSTLM